jgi:hypothetical protein
MVVRTLSVTRIDVKCLETLGCGRDGYEESTLGEVNPRRTIGSKGRVNRGNTVATTGWLFFNNNHNDVMNSIFSAHAATTPPPTVDLCDFV